MTVVFKLGSIELRWFRESFSEVRWRHKNIQPVVLGSIVPFLPLLEIANTKTQRQIQSEDFFLKSSRFCDEKSTKLCYGKNNE